MSQFLDTLKERLAVAQQRLQTAQQKLNHAQAEHQSAMTDYSSWQNAVAAETRRENPNIAVEQMVLSQQPGQPPRLVRQVFHPMAPQPTATQPNVAQPAQSPHSHDDEVNKTDLIRSVLRQNPNGIRPADIWKQVKENVGRAYVYSVLNRLKQKREVSERRGKYFLQLVAKTEEGKEPTHIQ
jgi:hypothetical protein